MRISFDKIDWKRLKDDRRLKINIGLAVVLFIFFVFIVDMIFSAGRIKEIEKPKQETKVPADKKPEKKESRRPVPAKKKAIKPAELTMPSARIAVILDDAGGNIPDYSSIYSIKERLTIAVIPDMGTSARIAEQSKEKGLEVILHLPMESLNGSYTRSGTGMITSSQSDDEIKKTLLDDLSSIKCAVGFNNHMGSKATADERVMKDVFEAVKGKKLFFIDSRTTTNSVAYQMAKKYGFPSNENNVFLDSVATGSYVEEKFKELVAFARKHGSAIGIGHATRPATIKALSWLMPEYEKHGIKFVYASELVK